VISEKNSLQADFEGKNSCKEIPGGKIPTLNKVSFMAYNSVYQGKKFLPKPNHPYPPQKPDGRPLTTYFEHMGPLENQLKIRLQNQTVCTIPFGKPQKV